MTNNDFVNYWSKMLSSSEGRSKLFLASSLWDALEDENLEQIKILVEKNGADPNVLLPKYGFAPFHSATAGVSQIFAQDATKLFLRHGGNPNVRSVNGVTPVHIAAACGREQILEMLLANGGDPLSLDDEGLSPFHYAFDEHFFGAIAILTQYCTESQDADKEDDDDDDEESKPKVLMKLEKVLVNRGDVVAEYIPSEIDLTNDTGYETKKNILSVCKIEHGKTEIFDPGNNNSLETKEKNSRDELVNLNDNNITFRRGQSHAAKYETGENVGSDDSICDSQEQNEQTNESTLDRSIDLNNPHTPTRIERKEKKKQDEKKNGYFHQIPQTRCFRNNLDSGQKTIKSTMLDTSIVSKSPNFKLPIKKRNYAAVVIPQQKDSTTWTRKYFTPEKIVCSPETKQSCTDGVAQNESVSSTPKRKHNRRKYKLKKWFEGGKCNRSPTNSSNETYVENKYDVSSSSDEEIKPRPMNIEKMYNAMYGRDVDHDPSAKIIDNKLHNGSIGEIRDRHLPLGFKLVPRATFEGTELLDRMNRIGVKSELIAKPQMTETNINKKSERDKIFLESPGSSHPRSASYQYQSIKNESDTNDELETMNEISAIYRDKGRTPPASISKLIDGISTSLNISDNSTSTVEKKILNCSNTSDDSIVDAVKQSNSVNDVDSGEFDESRTTEGYKTPQMSAISSILSEETFLSIDEEYIYVDAEKDVAFTERRLRVIPEIEDMNKTMLESTWLSRNGEFWSAASQTSQRTSSESNKIFNRGEYIISNASLRHQLTALGDNPGPITHTTYNLYLKRLYKLKQKNIKNVNECIIKPNSQNEFSFSPTVPSFLFRIDFMEKSEYYRNLEELAFREYETPNDKRKYLGGMGKTSFNYLLLDPRITNDLPRKGRDLSVAERWRIFLRAVFYVGKGKNARPFQHLYESHEIWTKNRHNDVSNTKIRKILDIWRDGKGVICHQVFQNSMQEEAFTREAAMIEALGIGRLSNCQRGTYYGWAATMGRDEQLKLGKYLLYKAMEILMHDGERQQFPRNIE